MPFTDQKRCIHQCSTVHHPVRAIPIIRAAQPAQHRIVMARTG